MTNDAYTLNAQPMDCNESVIEDELAELDARRTVLLKKLEELQNRKEQQNLVGKCIVRHIGKYDMYMYVKSQVWEECDGTILCTCKGAIIEIWEATRFSIKSDDTWLLSYPQDFAPHNLSYCAIERWNDMAQRALASANRLLLTDQDCAF